jgi:hypothetical protein
MKTARITEKDADYVLKFREYLISLGAVPVGPDEAVISVPDDLDLDRFHGLELDTGPEKPFREEFAEECEWLEAYAGTFDFYLSLKTQLAQKGKLSDRQIDAVRRAIIRDQERTEQRKTQATNQVFSLNPGQVIQVTKWAAKKFAAQAGYTRPHFAFEIIKVEAETPKAFRLTVKLTAQRTSFCCVCGLGLSNPASVTAGIGPICAEKSGVSFGAGSLEELAERLKVTVAVTDWIPKAAIKTVDGKPYEMRGY